MKDWRGITVAVGDTVLYASRQSSWMGITEGVVESIEENQAKVRITRRQGSGTKELVTVGDQYLTVVNLPTSSEPTMIEENIAQAARMEVLRVERELREAACGEHKWVNSYQSRRCDKCRRYEYGDYYPDGYTSRRYNY